jgi:hypothetical protein
LQSAGSAVDQSAVLNPRMAVVQHLHKAHAALDETTAVMQRIA